MSDTATCLLAGTRWNWNDSQFYLVPAIKHVAVSV